MNTRSLQAPRPSSFSFAQRHAFWRCVGLTAQTGPHTCVFVSSPTRIRDLLRQHNGRHESSNGSSAVYGLRTHTVKVKKARSSGWSLVHERINAVPFILLASRKTETKSVGGIMSGLRLLWHVIVFRSNLTCPSCVRTSKVGAWKHKRTARACPTSGCMSNVGALKSDRSSSPCCDVFT